jgi:leucyl-tRNA synthetase
MAEDGKKMSKRYGNVVNPDEIINEYGADTLRVYEMFMGPFEKAISWSTNSMIGISRFLERVYELRNKIDFDKKEDSKELDRIINETIKKVGEDIEGFKFNTAISQLMICLNSFEEEIKKGNKLSKEIYKKYGDGGYDHLLDSLEGQTAEKLEQANAWAALEGVRDFYAEKGDTKKQNLINSTSIEWIVKLLPKPDQLI